MNRLFIIAVAFAFAACSRQEKAEASWHRSAPGKKLLLGFSVPPNGERVFSIASTKALQLGIDSNASFELAERYKDSFPVRLEHRKSIEAIGTVFGASGVLFQPVDGEIPLVVKNGTDTLLEIAISQIE